MRERSYGQPQLAMLAYRSNEFSTMPAGARPVSSGHAELAAPMTAQQYGLMALATNRVGLARGGCGCACGCAGGRGISGCSECRGECNCGCSSCQSGARVFPPARRNEKGECESLFSISCETKWRLRECFKQSLCDLLRCVGDELCDEDGRIVQGKKPDLGKCLEGLVCSLVDCLPEAICPPPPPSTLCITQTLSDCDCNFTVRS